MFLENIISDNEYRELIEKYDEEFLNNINYDLFMKNYKYLISKRIYFINELIVRELEMFMLDSKVLEEVINIAYRKYGEKFAFILGENLNIFDDILVSVLERQI